MFKIKVPFTSLQNQVQSEGELLPRVAKMEDFLFKEVIAIEFFIKLQEGMVKGRKWGLKLHTQLVSFFIRAFGN